VRWTAPPDCPDREVVATRIAQRLGRPLADEAVAVDARVTTTDRGHEARVELNIGGHHEVRTLLAASCLPLAEAVALLVVAAIDAGARDRAATTPPTGSDPAPGPAPTPAPTAHPEDGELTPVPTNMANEPAPLEHVDPGRPRRRGPGMFVRLEGGPELGAVVRVSGAFGLGVGVLWRRFRLQFMGIAVVPRTVERALADLRAGLFAGAVTGCLRTGRGRFEVPLCAGVEVGGMRGEARRLPSGRGVVVPWTAAVLGVGLAVRVHPRVSVWSTLSAVIAVVRPRFELRGSGPPIPLLTPSPLSGRLLVGIEVRFADPS
jgi:hypothetical protein